MIEPRLYRAAFVPAFVAVLLVAFAFQQQPPPNEQPPAGGVIFDGESAARAARDLAASTPDRRSGTPGDMAVAAMVRKTLTERRFATQVDKWTDDDGKALVNVVGIKPGRSERQIVVVAARDAHTTPDTAGSAADTTALLEIAHVLQGRASTRTVVLLSADGSADGEAGVRRWLASSASPGLIDGVIVIDQLGASRSAGPLVVGWGNSHLRTSIGLERTARNALTQELGAAPMIDSFARQIPRVALPIGLGGQGPLVSDGIDAVRISGSGELDPPSSDQLNGARYEQLGRAVMRVFGALNDQGAPGHGPPTYLTLGTKYLPGWAISLLALALLLPLVIASVDAFARARRQREPVGVWFGWLAAGFFGLAIGWLIAEATVLVGLIPDPPPAPLQPALGEEGDKPRTVFTRTHAAAEVAKPLYYRGQANWVVLYSRPFDDVADAVKLVRKRLLQASALALAVTLLAGFFAARMVGRRVRVVERAARAVSEGRDVEPIKVRSNDELGSLAVAFNEMQERLKQVDRARREFIANASHELRTPIFSLGGFVELLQDEELDETTRAEFLATMHEQVDRLQKLAVDLLDLSRMDAGSLRLEDDEVDLASLATEIAAEFRPAEARHGAPLELNLPAEPVDAVCDRERVAQIMRILLDNALRHTPEGTPVTVGASRRGSVAEFSVSDSGPGIDPSTRGQLFERFYTGDKARGSGLGLAIAKELAERMHGRIVLYSVPGRTTFALELPGTAVPIRDPQPAGAA